MKAYKRADRIIKMRDFVRASREVSQLEEKIVSTWMKWLEVQDGRVSWKMTVWKLTNKEGTEFYICEDSLGWMATTAAETYTEVKEWMEKHGYKPEKKWYMEDYGMTEETWNEWNNCSDE